MIQHELHGQEGLLTVRVSGPLTADDFAGLAAQVDPYLEKHGELRGMMIVSAGLPDWSSVEAFLSHLRFVRAHHKRIRRVALVSDSGVVATFEKFADHFVAAELQHFPMEAHEDARRWVLETDPARD